MTPKNPQQPDGPVRKWLTRITPPAVAAFAVAYPVATVLLAVTATCVGVGGLCVAMEWKDRRVDAERKKRAQEQEVLHDLDTMFV